MADKCTLDFVDRLGTLAGDEIFCGNEKMSKYTNITMQEMDDLLTPDKGWIKNVVGNEYIYDFHLAKYPVIVKVASSIRVDSNRARNKGSDAIRVFAVTKASTDVKAKVTGGLCKAKRVYRVEGWRDNTKAQVIYMIAQAKKIYDKYRR